LSLSEVGIDDDFFELGGNSILGMKLIARVTEKYDIQLRVLALLKNSTIKSMGQLVDQLVSARPG
jgi:acyl carrier protein